MAEPLPWDKKAQEEAEKKRKEIETEQKEVEQDMAEAAKVAKLLDKL